MKARYAVWRGVDIVAAIRVLGSTVYRFYAEDTRMDAINTAKNGARNTKQYSNERNRSWLLCTVGHGEEIPGAA